jgi:hypothetical protein
MSTFKQTRPAEPLSKLVSQERRRAKNRNELTTQGDYHRPFGKVEARLHMNLQRTLVVVGFGFFLTLAILIPA